MFEVDFSIHLSMSRAVFECDYRTVYVPVKTRYASLTVCYSTYVAIAN